MKDILKALARFVVGGFFVFGASAIISGCATFHAEDDEITDAYKAGLKYKNGDGVPKDPRVAAEYFHRAADAGNASAQFELGEAYYYGRGVIASSIEAEKWYGKAVAAGNVSAQMELGRAYIWGSRGISYDREKGLGLWEKAASTGYDPAAVELANTYEKGLLRVERNAEKSAYWYLQSAQLGNSASQFKLGSMYEKGFGVAVDYEKAFAWYLRSAENGDVDAQYRLGKRYDQGLNTLRDTQSARFWLAKAVEQGSKDARFYLVNFYRHTANDASVDQYQFNFSEIGSAEADRIRSLTSLAQASLRGDTKAMQELSKAYLTAAWVLRDREEGIRLLARAADLGDNEARYTLAELYFGSLSGKPYDYDFLVESPQKTLDLHLQAANAGYAPSQYKLAYYFLYQYKDTKGAVCWLDKAAKNNDADAINLLRTLKQNDEQNTIQLLRECL